MTQKYSHRFVIIFFIPKKKSQKFSPNIFELNFLWDKTGKKFLIEI